MLFFWQIVVYVVGTDISIVNVKKGNAFAVIGKVTLNANVRILVRQIIVIKRALQIFLIFVVLLLSGSWYMRFRSWKQCNYHMHTMIPCPGHTRSGCLLEKIHNEAIRAYLAEETEPTQGNVHDGNSYISFSLLYFLFHFLFRSSRGYAE